MLARGARRDDSRHGNINGLVSLDTSPICVLLATRSRTTVWQSNTGHSVSVLAVFADTILVSRQKFPGRVGEWLKPADCKSAAPCGLRRFESFPVHQALVVGLQKTAGQSHERCSKAVQFGAQAPLRKSAPRRIEFG